MKIRYSERVSSTTLLGPGDRAVLWVYGCCFNCPGCIALNFRQGPWLEASPEELAQWFLSTGQSHITISGGEPMLQAGLLAEMLRQIRAQRDIGVIVYSGFTYEALLEKVRKAAESPDGDGSAGSGGNAESAAGSSNGDEDAGDGSGIRDFLSQIDILIDGPYVDELNHNEPYRGSSNQRILLLTDRYADAVDGYYYSGDARNVEIRIQSDKTLMIGVPSRDQASIWARVKRMGEQVEAIQAQAQARAKQAQAQAQVQSQSQAEGSAVPRGSHEGAEAPSTDAD